jgi:hypothetical protein
MKHVLNVSLILVIFASLSFTKASGGYLTGIYGVSKNDPSKIELTLNDDHTFRYQDFSNPAKRIDVSGKWELKGKFVILKNTTVSGSFHNKWKISQDGVVAKSRKGMTFYTLNKCAND